MSTLTPAASEERPIKGDHASATPQSSVRTKHFFLPATPVSQTKAPITMAQLQQHNSSNLIPTTTLTTHTSSITPSSPTLTSPTSPKEAFSQLPQTLPMSPVSPQCPSLPLRQPQALTSTLNQRQLAPKLVNLGVQAKIETKDHTIENSSFSTSNPLSPIISKTHTRAASSPSISSITTTTRTLSGSNLPSLSSSSTPSFLSSPATTFLSSPSPSTDSSSNLRGLETLANVSARSKGTPKKNKKDEVSTPSSVTSDDSIKSLDDENYKRKDKSLSLLCQNFLKTYGGDDPCEISLGEASSNLSVERRRIYDIIHVFESLGIMKRLGKNRYKWHGLAKLPEAISSIRKVDNLPRREKSLGSLSHKFVLMFLQSETRVVTLEEASSMLSSFNPSDDEQTPKKNTKTKASPKQKTKIRRLYDIANVLSSLDLIKKTKVLNGSSFKSAFEWIGPVGKLPSKDEPSPMLNSDLDTSSTISSPAAPSTPDPEVKQISRKRKSNSKEVLSPAPNTPIPSTQEKSIMANQDECSEHKKAKVDTPSNTPQLDSSFEFKSPTKLKTLDNKEVILPGIPVVHESMEIWKAYFKKLDSSLKEVCVGPGMLREADTGFGLIQLSMASRALESPKVSSLPPTSPQTDGS